MEKAIKNELTYKIIDVAMVVNNAQAYGFPNRLVMKVMSSPHLSNTDSQIKIQFIQFIL